MNKFKLTIDTESINLENEIHMNNFSQKIKNLAFHCVNYILGIEDENHCSNNKFLREFHDENDYNTTIEVNNIPFFIKNKINSNIYKKSNFQIYDTE